MIPLNYMGIIDKYREYLPVDRNTPSVTLNEGNTPLILLSNLTQSIDKEVYWYAKFEGLNPTGSFKDRGMTLAVTKAAEMGSKAILCASTGNTSASAAAYAARAQMRAFVLIPEGNVALGKLAQAMIHGATVLQMKGNFDVLMDIVKKIASTLPITLVNSVNPYRLQGQKTAAFEIVEQLGRAPDYHALPVGNAGNISSYWMGYTEFKKKGVSLNTPVMLGYQAQGAAPFVEGHAIENPNTVATAIRIGHPQSWDLALTAKEESKGWFKAVSDEDILSAQKLLAEREGIFCEPASAASIAGVIADLKNGTISSGSIIVSTLTGHGLKDPDIALKQTQKQMRPMEANFNAVRNFIENQI